MLVIMFLKDLLRSKLTQWIIACFYGSRFFTFGRAFSYRIRRPLLRIDTLPVGRIVNPPHGVHIAAGRTVLPEVLRRVVLGAVGGHASRSRHDLHYIKMFPVTKEYPVCYRTADNEFVTLVRQMWKG